MLERPSIGEYWNISGVPVLPENVIFTFLRTCWCYSEAYNTGTQKMVWYCPILVYQYLGLEVYFFPFFFQVSSLWAQGRHSEARRASSSAKGWAIAAFFVGCIVIIGNIIRVIAVSAGY